MTLRYLNVLLHCASEPWAMQKEKLVDISNFLKFKATGGDFTSEEVQARISQKRAQDVSRMEGVVGILPIYGVISQRMNMLEDISGGTSTEQLAQQFRRMLADNSVKAIVADFHTPGGTSYGIEDLGNEIYESRGIKPMIAQVNSVAASAGYWLACQFDEIVMTPGAQAGSIGVYSIHEDISKMLEKEGIKETLISAGDNKTLGNELEPLSDEARTVIQKRVNETNLSFVRAVARGRNVSMATVNEKFGQGLMFGGPEAVKLGMADGVAGMSATLERFGIHLNPALSKVRGNGPRAQATEELITKLSAGDRPTVRELENGLKGLGLSNSAAERAVRVLFKDNAQGEPEKPETDQPALASALAEFRQQLDGFTLPKI